MKVLKKIMKVLKKIMKILKKGKPTVKWTCPVCGSLLELEPGDIEWHTDYSGDNAPYVKCPVCGKFTDVEGNNEIRKKLY